MTPTDFTGGNTAKAWLVFSYQRALRRTAEIKRLTGGVVSPLQKLIGEYGLHLDVVRRQFRKTLLSAFGFAEPCCTQV